MSCKPIDWKSGENDGAEKKDIVGAIANEAGIESRYMGKIYMADTFSTIELPEGMPEEIFQELKSVKVKGKSLNLSEIDISDINELAGKGSKTRGSRSKTTPERSRKKDKGKSEKETQKNSQ